MDDFNPITFSWSTPKTLSEMTDAVAAYMIDHRGLAASIDGISRMPVQALIDLYADAAAHFILQHNLGIVPTDVAPLVKGACVIASDDAVVPEGTTGTGFIVRDRVLGRPQHVTVLFTAKLGMPVSGMHYATVPAAHLRRTPVVSLAYAQAV